MRNQFSKLSTEGFLSEFIEVLLAAEEEDLETVQRQANSLDQSSIEIA
jgi:hypothetical protein